MGPGARRWLKRGLLGVACAPLGLVSLLCLALALPVSRQPLVRAGLQLTNRALDGTRIELDQVERLDLWGVDVRGLRVFDAHGRPQVSVASASLRLAPFALLHNTLHLTHAVVDGVRVHVYPSEPEPEEPDSAPSSFQVLADQLQVSDAELEMQVSGRALHARLGLLAGAGAYGPRTRASLWRAELSADLDGQRALQLRSVRGHWDEQRGGEFALRGQLLDAPLEITAQVPPLEGASWPVQRARLKLDGLTQRGLARVGLADAVLLRAPLSLQVTLTAPRELLQGELRLSVGDAELVLSGEATQSLYRLRARFAPSQLSQSSGLLPELRVGFDLHAELRPRERPLPLALEWRELTLDGRAVPDGALSARLALPEVELTHLSLRGLEHALRVSGKYDSERGTGELSLESSELPLGALGGLVPPGLSGTLDGGIHARLERAKLQGKLALALRAFRLNETQVGSANLTLDVAGPLLDPRGDLVLSAEQVVAGGAALSRVSLRAHAGTRDLSGKLTFEGPDRTLALDVIGKRSADGSALIDAGGTGQIQQRPLRIKLVELKLAAGSYSLRELSVSSGHARLSAAGSFDAQHHIMADLTLQNLDIAPWAQLLGEPLSGTLDLTAHASGSAAAPKLSAELSGRALHSERAPRAPAVDLSTQLSLDAPGRRASLKLHAQSPDRRVLAELSVQAQLERRARDLAQAFERGRFDAELDARSDVPFAAQFAGAPLSRLDGTLRATLSLAGTLAEPSLNASAEARLWPLEQPAAAARPDRIELGLAVTPKQADAKLQISDRAGALFTAATQLELPAGGPRALAADTQALLTAPKRLSMKLAERRLDQLQGGLATLAEQYQVALPVRAAAEISAESSGAALTAALRVRAHVWGEGLAAQCPAPAQADLTLVAKLADERAELSLDATAQGGGRAHVELQSAVATRALLGGGGFAWGPAALRARGDELLLHTFPGLCSLPASRTRFTLSVDDLGKGPLRSSLELDVDQIRGSPTQAPLAIQLRANSDARALNAAGELKLGGAQRGKLSARVPLAYPAGAPLPEVPRDQPLAAALSLADFPLAGLASFTQAIGRAQGSVRADLRLSGSLAAPQPAGFLELSDAAFSIAALAQPFSNVNARFELARDKLSIRKLEAHDRSGKLSLHGEARYALHKPGTAHVALAVERFPLRQQGSIIGELSTRAQLDGKLNEQGQLWLSLDIHEGRVWLTGKGGRKVQQLEDHPDVRYGDQHGPLEPEASDAADSGGISLAELQIRSDRGLWLMHEDFSVQVSVDIRLKTGPAGTSLAGEAKLPRGELNILGKPFRIQAGSAVRFTGDVPPDPELDLKATHTLRTGQGLTVQVLGRASAPQIVFSGAASNAGEAAMLLTGMGGGGADSKAKGDVGSFAAGLTAGLLAVSARRRFGDWVPMLALENNAQGAPSGARAGFDATRLIPGFMQGFARGMFVEGVVGNRNDGSSQTGVGVRVELALPRDFTTSMGYGPGTVWSTDVYWSP